MEIKKITSWIILSLLPVICANATPKAAKTTTTTGDNSPAVIGDHTTINYSSAAAIDKIVAVYATQHQLDTEQIKSLTTAVTALSQGKGVSGTESQIKAALDALAQGNTALAKALFEKETQRVELAAKQGAAAYRNLGALAFLNNTQEALQAYRRATQLDPDDATGWNELGTLLMRVGDLDDAIAAYSKVLALGESQQDKEKIAWAYGNLGSVYFTRGDLDKAVEFYEKGLAIQIALGDKQGMAAKYGNLGNVYKTRGDLNKAIEFYQKALTLHEALGSKEGMAQNYSGLGLVYFKRGDLNKAIEFQQKALTLDEDLGSKEGMAQNYGNLGLVYDKRGDLDKAIEFYQKSLAIAEALGIKETSANQYANLGLVYEQKGNKAEAKRYYQKSIELYNTLGSPNAKKVQGWLDKL